MRMLRASRPIINDPLLNEYVSSLGHRLVANASDVKTPFHFFLIRNKEINAFAFFGGYVALHTGLFLYAQNESELASVVAHEIAHITQRHLARAMEDQARKSPLTIAALIGSLMLAVAAPEAGIAAAQATTAASIQSRINYTRSNEQEADRIGIDTLARAGFNPKAMPVFFGRMLEQYRYASKPPEFLLTHPLPESRITESRARASNTRQSCCRRLSLIIWQGPGLSRASPVSSLQPRWTVYPPGEKGISVCQTNTRIRQGTGVSGHPKTGKSRSHPGQVDKR